MSVEEVVEQKAPVRKRTTRTPRTRTAAAAVSDAAPIVEPMPAAEAQTVETPNGTAPPAIADAALESTPPAAIAEPVNTAAEGLAAPAVAVPDKIEAAETPAPAMAEAAAPIVAAPPPEAVPDRERPADAAPRHGRDRRHRRDGRSRPDGDRSNGAERGVITADGHDGRGYAPPRPRPSGPGVQVGPPSRNGGPPHLTIAELDAKSPEELFEMARGFELQGYS
ncbi:MAG TPA: hypothetical protein VFQ80_02235, partial [Thermomicrobiales bacterium]|nr:hypothetical protein [Thermomicrobiales bacterium]